VDQVQFCLVTGNAGPAWQEGQMLALPDGSPAAWQLPGNASEWTQNYDTPYFRVEQEGGWFTKKPKRIFTKAQLDPSLCLLIGHLGTSEFSAAGILEAFHPDFPHDPRGAVMMGMLRPTPPPPPVVIVQQPYQVSYVQTTTTYTTVQQQLVPAGGGYAQQPQMAQPMQQMPMQPMAQAMPGQQMPMAQAMPGQQMPMAQAMPGQQMPMAQAMPGQQMPQAMPMAPAMPGQQMAYAQPYPQQDPNMAQAAMAQPAVAQAVAQPAPVEQAAPPADDPAAKLAKLKTLLDQGLIDQDDYDQKKDAILAAM